MSLCFISFTQGAGQRDGSVPALGGYRWPAGGCVGPGTVLAARRGLCRPWDGIGHQEEAVSALGGYRTPGGYWPSGGVCAGPGRVLAARRRLCRPWEGTGR